MQFRRILALGAMALATASCSGGTAVMPTTSTPTTITTSTLPTTSTPTTGIVTGFADNCAGALVQTVGSHPGAPNFQTVYLYSGRRLVASETVRVGASYRFSVTPGRYYVAGTVGSKGVVVVQPGRVVSDSFPRISCS
jgi:hypothetical protein